MFTRALIVVVVASGVCGCHALQARMVAQDGVKAYHSGKIDEAAAMFAEAAELAPDNASIQINLGFAELGRFQAQPTTVKGQASAKKAITAFKHYLELRPEEERAQSYLVQTFVDAGQYDAAKEYFQTRVEKKDPVALATLGGIAAKTGRFEEARAWYERRVQAEPNNPEARLALGVLLWDHLHTHPSITGEDRTKLADAGIEALKESIRLAPNAPSAYSYTTMLLSERALAAKNDDEKRKDLEAAQRYFKLSAAPAKDKNPKKGAR
jgi:tetratricopeptide (TPR) repeat protein